MLYLICFCYIRINYYYYFNKDNRGYLPVLTCTTPKPKHIWIELTSTDSNLSIEFTIKETRKLSYGLYYTKIEFWKLFTRNITIEIVFARNFFFFKHLTKFYYKFCPLWIFKISVYGNGCGIDFLFVALLHFYLCRFCYAFFAKETREKKKKEKSKSKNKKRKKANISFVNTQPDVLFSTKNIIS